METYFMVIVKSSFCLSVFYLIGLLLYRKNHAFRQQRFFLLASLVISMSLPFNRFSVQLFRVSQPALQATQVPTAVVPADHHAYGAHKPVSVSDHPGNTVRSASSYVEALQVMYWVVTIILLMRIVYSLIYVVVYYILSERTRYENVMLLFHTSIKGSFSFMHWIFMNKSGNAEGQPILKHEIVHARQFHSLDVAAV